MTSKEELNNQKELNSEKKKELSLEQQLINLLAERRGIDSEILTDNENIANVIQSQVKNMSFEVIQRSKIKSLSTSIAKIASDSYAISKDQLGLTKTNADIANKQVSIAKNVVLLEQQKKQLLDGIEDGTASNARLNKDIADSIDAQVNSANKLSKDLDKVSQNSKEISNNFGVKAFSGLSAISKSIPGLSKFSGPFESAAESARGMAANIQEAAQSGGESLTKEKITQLGLEKKLGNLTGEAASNAMKGMSKGAKSTMAMKAGFKALGPMLKKALGPLSLIIEAVQAFTQIDKAAGDTAKSMGVSYNEAAQLNAEMADAASMSGDLLVSSKDVVAANQELNKIFGTAAEFSGELAVEFASIKEKTGLSAHAMELFAEKAFLTGTSIEDQLVKVTAVTQELNNQNDVAFSAKEIQEGIAQMSNSQILNNKMNTKEMANQVFQAKLLGISQSQLENVQSSLLDFESSIAAEMKAELLTGKQLNLEGARAAALSGNQAELAAEIRKEIGTAAEFSEYNVVQQEALAAAMGMSRDDMAGMLIEQEKLVKLQNVFGDEVTSVSEAQEKYNKLEKEGLLTAEMKKKLAEEGVLNQMQSASQQDKMNAAMDKFSDLFIQLVDPLMPLIDALMAILEPIMSILSPIAKLIGDIVGLIVTGLNPLFKSLKDYFDGFNDVITGLFNLDFNMMIEGFKKIGGAIISFLVHPLDGAIELANLVPGVDIPLASTKFKGMVGLAEGGIVTAPTTALIGEGGEPEAVIPLSKASSMGFGGGDNSDEIKQTNALLKELISAVKQGGDVYIDGAKAGRSLALATSRMG